MNKLIRNSRWSLLLILGAIFVLLNVHQAEAQYFAFGKNRVQYKDFNWRYIQSEHFDVYYYTSRNYMLATFAAISEEAALKEIEEDFGHQINDRIEAIIYDSHNDFSETNVVSLPTSAEGIGGVTDPYKNRVTLPYEGDYDQFRQVLHHELVHAVINDMFYGGNVQSRLSGNALEIPIWFNEGMAEYSSLGFDTNTDMFIRDAAINDYLPSSLQQLNGYFAYRGGESFWNFIVQEYGRNKITEIFQTLKNTRSVEATFQRTLGLSMKQLSKRWKDYYRERYLPEVANREDLDDFGDLLTERGKTGTYNTSPAFSPQGDKIALITNNNNAFNVVVINAVTGKRLKTLIEGSGNTNFEELNILNPNLSWSPDGTKIALSAKSEGKDHLAIVDYKTGNKNYIAFPNIDAIGSVAWSPDGNKIAFDGNIGAFQDIFVYNLQTKKLTNITNDVCSDKEPTWGSDSQTIYFTSARGDQLELNKVKNNAALLSTDDMYSTDIYSIKLGDQYAQRLTKTPNWNEHQPETTRDGRLVFISDENGIPNVYELNVADRTTTPLTNLQTGAEEISLSGDGSRLAISSLNEGYLDIFTVSAPFSRAKSGRLSDNKWANRRANEPVEERVPAIGYARQLARSKQFVQIQPQQATQNPFASPSDSTGSQPDSTQSGSMMAAAQQDTTQPDTAQTEEHDNSNIDFRHYAFEPEVEQDTAFANKYLDEDVFDIKNNTTDDGRYIPTDYRLKFSTDLVYAGGGFSTYYGSNGVVQILFSDLLGDHEIAFGSDLQFDLRNSSYFLQYANFKNRTNWIFNLSHTAYSYLTYSNESLRYRFFSGGVTAQYPFNKFQRIDFSLSGISISQDYTIIGIDSVDNENSSFLYPQVTFTNDKSVPGYITPVGGFRYAIGLSASPPISSKTLQFASILGDFRKYLNLGSRYSFALRGSAGASFGRDAQTYFLGGMQGWINRQYSSATIPLDRFGQSFIAQPAIPLRGHKLFAITGNKFALANAEFRFPLFAAILPGPIPIIPLYNLTGVAFVDAGMAWGQDITYNYSTSNGTASYYTNDASLDFAIQNQNTVSQNGQDLSAPEGDVLVGAGFGLRTIVFGLPLRYDVGWPYYRHGFDGGPVHYVTIGIDF